MKDFKDQLQGLAVPPGSPTPAPTEPVRIAAHVQHPILGEHAHQGAEWWRRAKAVKCDGAPKRQADAKLHAAIQQTDGLLKALKNAGRKREGEDIAELRKRWLGERDQLAWGIVKDRFAAMSVSDKLYRSLKQGDVDPVDVLRRLDAADPDTLKGMGKDRLKALLTE